MPNYYDWHTTLSYDADITMVIGPRGVGKTFGLRKQCIEDFIKRGSRFVEVVRYKNELSDVSDGYFNRLQDMFDGYLFKTNAHYGYIAKEPARDDNDEYVCKPDWNLLCYFTALTEGQKLKKRTFDRVRRIIFDESILESDDRFHHYLPNEFEKLANLVDTVSRERADNDSVPPRLYLLGNACDISNPYFAAYRVETDLHYGYRWYARKTFLLHYLEPDEYSREKAKGTVAGRMLSGTRTGNTSIYNEFSIASSDFVKAKPKTAKFSFGIVVDGKRFGIWADVNEGLYFVNTKIPENTDKPVYSLTAEDHGVNYLAAQRANKTLSYFRDMYYMNAIRYSTPIVKQQFLEMVLARFGIR